MPVSTFRQILWGYALLLLLLLLLLFSFQRLSNLKRSRSHMLWGKRYFTCSWRFVAYSRASCSQSIKP